MLLIRYYYRLLRDFDQHLGKDFKQDSEPSSAEPLPTTTNSITELDQLSSKFAEESHQVLAKLDRKFMLQELAGVSRTRDYINHLDSELCRESGYVEHLLLANRSMDFHH